MMTIDLQYFREHPDARDGVMKAYYAYNVPHFRSDPKSHNFGSSQRESACHWCGRTREQVRWDELPPECAKRPPVPEIEDVILGEERKAFALLARAEKDVPKLLAKLGMLNGETMAILHHTYGYDPETVSGVVDVPPVMIMEYNEAMMREQARSRAAIKREIVMVRWGA